MHDDDCVLHFFNDIKTYVDRIRERGGKVIFMRTPSSGPMLELEEKKYPRSQYWDALLSHTQAGGIHFKDDPITAGMICPEWSHLSPKDVMIYTRQLVKTLKEKGWFATAN